MGRKKRKKNEMIEIDMDRVPSKDRPAAAVMFTVFTSHSSLAVKMREAEEKLGSLTGYKLKVVERAGTKLEDILHKSDPWQGKDCCRKKCMLCATKSITNKNQSQDCHKRSAVYEIWCLDCQRREEKII